MSAANAIVMAPVFLICSACATSADQGGNETQDITSRLTEEEAQIVMQAREAQAAAGYSEKEQAAIDLAISKVNERTPASRDSVSNIRIRSIQWPDSSLGCPEPDMMYQQVLVPGYVVSFKVDETIHTVNVGENRAVICDRINDFMLERRKRADAVLRAHKAAKLDLAERLDVDPRLVEVSKIEVETWSDSSLGCPRTDQQYDEGPIEGLRIEMTCRDNHYEYRVSLEGEDFVICEEIVSCHEME